MRSSLFGWVEEMARMKKGYVDDLATLSELNEEIILEELEARYNQDVIYVRNQTSFTFRRIFWLSSLLFWYCLIPDLAMFEHLQTYVGDILIALNPFKHLNIYHKNVSKKQVKSVDNLLPE